MQWASVTKPLNCQLKKKYLNLVPGSINPKTSLKCEFLYKLSTYSKLNLLLWEFNFFHVVHKSFFFFFFIPGHINRNFQVLKSSKEPQLQIALSYLLIYPGCKVLCQEYSGRSSAGWSLELRCKTEQTCLYTSKTCFLSGSKPSLLQTMPKSCDTQGCPTRDRAGCPHAVLLDTITAHCCQGVYTLNKQLSLNYLVGPR